MKAEAKIVPLDEGCKTHSYTRVNIYLGDQTFFFRDWGPREAVEKLVQRLNTALQEVTK